MSKMTVKKIKQIADQVVLDQYDSMTEENIAEEMKDLIKDCKDDLYKAILGIKKGWGGELSLTNDGSFSRMISNMNQYKLNTIAKNMLEELFGSEDIVFSDKEIAHLHSIYKKEYKEVIEEKLIELAQENAAVDAPLLFKEFLEQEQ